MAKGNAVVVDLGEFRKRREVVRQDAALSSSAALPQTPFVMWYTAPMWVILPYWAVM
jgi:hypothetical protein